MIYVKTDSGRQALKERAESMPRKYHFPFLACDGVRDSADILRASASQGFLEADLQHLAQLGYIKAVVAQSAAGSKSEPVLPTAAQVANTQRNVNSLIEAQQMATALTAKLGLRGFRVNMAVEAAHSLADLRALLPRIQEAVGPAAAKALADLLKTADA
jgi:hypothetical protein